MRETGALPVQRIPPHGVILTRRTTPSSSPSDYAGIGFVLADSDPFCGIDFDDCLDESNNLIWGEDLIRWLGTYTEISPSGRGVKLFLRGIKPSSARCTKRGMGADGLGDVEVYEQGRFFAVTGNPLAETPTEITDRQEELNALCDYLWPPTTTAAVSLSQFDDRRTDRCLEAMLSLRVEDKNDGSFRLHAVCCRCVEHDLSDQQAVALIRQYEQLQPFPGPWSDSDILKRLRSAEAKCARGAKLDLVPQVDLSGLLENFGLGTDPESAASDTDQLPLADRFRPRMQTIGQLMASYPRLRPPLIHGLLRNGETMNVIAAPKTGKSWLTTDLALSIVSGRPWFGQFPTESGSVLIIDNELHAETSAFRVPQVALARGIPRADFEHDVLVENLRGRLMDIERMEFYFKQIEPYRFRMIILDAFYRFLPDGTDENDNARMAAIYNRIDQYADRLGSSFVLVHHTSKGNQAEKSVTDVGAGAGSQSRATDAHVVLRPHEEEGCVVLNAAVRSWPPVDATVFRWQFPVWMPEPDLDPARLRRPYRRSRTKSDERKSAAAKWTSERFVEAFVTEEPKTKTNIIDSAVECGLSERNAEKLLNRCEDQKRIFRWKLKSSGRVAFASCSQPVPTKPDSEAEDRRDKVEQLIEQHPDWSNRQIAKKCGTSHTYVNNVRSERAEP